MDTSLLIIAHAPLADALRRCVGHVFPDQIDALQAYDVPAEDAPDLSLARLRRMLEPSAGRPLLLLTDVQGATPCNLACRLAGELAARQPVRVVAGVNLPMLLRAVTYRDQPLQQLLDKVLAGGTQGILEVH